MKRMRTAPGYEQLNYLYDARNEALLSLYLCGDTTLPKRTIRLFRDTLTPDGMIASRTPSALRQTIPIFALWWPVMVHDLWQWAGETERPFIADCLITVDAILAYFRNHLRAEWPNRATPVLESDWRRRCPRN